MTCFFSDVYLHELLILVIKRLSVLSVVKGGDTDYLFFFVDNWQGENVLYGPAAGVERLSLLLEQQTRISSRAGS